MGLREGVIMNKQLKNLLETLQAVHVYGQKRLSKIKSFKPRKLSNGDVYLVCYDKRGKIVRPRHIPKIGKKSNMSKTLRDIVSGS